MLLSVPSNAHPQTISPTLLMRPIVGNRRLRCTVAGGVLALIGWLVALPAGLAQELVWAKQTAAAASQRGGNTDAGQAMARDASGNLYVTGNFSYTADFDPGPGTADLTAVGNHQDIFLAKYDPTGAYLWAISIGGTESDFGLALAVDNSGNVILTGTFRGTVDFDPGSGTALRSSAGQEDIFLAKYDPSGNYLWALTMGGTEKDSGNSVAVDADGNVYLTGEFDGAVDFAAGGGAPNVLLNQYIDAFVAKYDSNGKNLWAIRMGGTTTDAGTSIALDGTGRLYIAGKYRLTANFGGGNTLFGGGQMNTFLAQYDADSGACLWAVPVRGTSDVVGTGVVANANGDLYLTGHFGGTANFGSGAVSLSSRGGMDGFLAKYNAAGNLIWATHFGGTGSDSGNGLALDAHGNVYVAGHFNGAAQFNAAPDPLVSLDNLGREDGFLAQYAPDGTCLWARSMGGPENDRCLGVVVDVLGNAGVTGFFTHEAHFDGAPGSAPLTTFGGDIFVARYDASGAYLRADQLGFYPALVAFSTNNAMARAASGNLYVAGPFQGLVDLDPGPDTAYLMSHSTQSIYIAKYDAQGTYQWAFQLNNRGDFAAFGGPLSIALDDHENMYVTGHYRGTIDFDPGPGTLLMTSLGWDLFLAKYNASGTLLWAIGIGGNGEDRGSDLAVDANGDVYLTGFFEGNVDFDPGTGTTILSSDKIRTFVAKYSASGALLWAFPLARGSSFWNSSLAVDPSGNLYVSGAFFESGDFDPGPGVAQLTSAIEAAFLAKYSASGAYQWAFHLPTSANIYPRHVAVDAHGDVYLTGRFRGTVDFDPGISTADLSSTSQAAFVAKYESSGAYAWAYPLGTEGFNAGTKILPDHNGRFYLTGVFQGTADFAAASGIPVVLTSAGQQDAFLALYDQAGACLWAINMGGTSSDQGNCLAVEGNDHVFVGGIFQGTEAEFDPILGGATLVSKQSGAAFLAKYRNLASSSVSATAATATFRLQPNPTSDVLWMDLSEYGGQPVFVSVHNALGALIWERSVAPVPADGRLSVRLREAGAGVYTVSVRSASGAVASKRVVVVD